MEDFYLRKPNKNDEMEVMLYRKEFTEKNEYINGSSGLSKINNYKVWLKKISDENDINNNPIRSELLMIRQSDNEIVGMINIRHSLESGFEISGGHIGYSIRPSERKKGYGNIILALALKYCKTLEIESVLVTCSKTNVASKKVILNNGGIFESEIEENGKIIERYWIKN